MHPIEPSASSMASVIAGSSHAERSHELHHRIEHAVHLLPSQGPIEVFVHHNTLHAFEDLPFDDAVTQGAVIYGCHGYWTEERFRDALARDRIRGEDLAEELLADLGDDASKFIGNLGTRYGLWLAMLQYPLTLGTNQELQWLLAESDALQRFRKETPADVREQMIDSTRRWVMRDLRPNDAGQNATLPIVGNLFEKFPVRRIEQWSLETWEAFTLHLLWNICVDGVAGLPKHTPTRAEPIRLRDLLLETTGEDADLRVHEFLIRFCAAFLDHGIAQSTLPEREHGFLAAWLAMYRDSKPVDRWLGGLTEEIRRIERLGLDAAGIIDECLQSMGICDQEEDAYIAQTLLALRGWAGMLWQMETNAEWTIRPAPRGTLMEYLAVRLLLERLSLTRLARETLGETGSLSELRSVLKVRYRAGQSTSPLQRASLVFQLAQLRRWNPESLAGQSREQWWVLVKEIEAFHGDHRRRIYQRAFERHYRTEVLDAVAAQAGKANPAAEKPSFQIVCCIDDREESFRRHLEEIAPDCETFGIAGFFGVAMYYRGAADAHYVPLCPIVMKPSHYVEEEVAFSLEDDYRRRTEVRRAIGMTSHRLHQESRSVLGGMLSSVFGTLASIPLVARVLFPHLTARLRRLLQRFVEPPPVTRLVMERSEPEPGPEVGHLGYSVDEMSSIAERCLQDIGLTSRFSRLVVMMGHGSGSLNNPHASAYNCGACGGGRGGPNARAIAAILNDPRVRSDLSRKGLAIPPQTYFLGGFHNTCSEQVSYYDLDRLPTTHRRDFMDAKLAIDEARRRNAHERCRRFESARLTMSRDAALRHVEERAEDLSQVRPEYGHATNAVCIVGRRRRTRGLFLDRRAFLTSYDPDVDDANHMILTRILQAVIPVCAGINLEYYFGAVDAAGYGCGTKLPHNITGLLGVMDGAASDLRPGLNWQMVELHEPMRILFVIEATPETICEILEKNPPLKRLVFNEWIQLAALDPNRPNLRLFRKGQFEAYTPESTTIPVVPSSIDWYRGWRSDLGLASIAAGASGSRSVRSALAAPG